MFTKGIIGTLWERLVLSSAGLLLSMRLKIRLSVWKPFTQMTQFDRQNLQGKRSSWLSSQIHKSHETHRSRNVFHDTNRFLWQFTVNWNHPFLKEGWGPWNLGKKQTAHVCKSCKSHDLRVHITPLPGYRCSKHLLWEESVTLLYS